MRLELSVTRCWWFWPLAIFAYVWHLATGYDAERLARFVVRTSMRIRIAE